MTAHLGTIVLLDPWSRRLAELADSGFVHFLGSGSAARIWPSNVPIPTDIEEIDMAVVDQIVEVLRLRPGLTAKEIAAKLERGAPQVMQILTHPKHGMRFRARGTFPRRWELEASAAKAVVPTVVAPTMVVPEDWSTYGPCPAPSCAASPGEPCCASTVNGGYHLTYAHPDRPRIAVETPAPLPAVAKADEAAAVTPGDGVAAVPVGAVDLDVGMRLQLDHNEPGMPWVAHQHYERPKPHPEDGDTAPITGTRRVAYGATEEEARQRGQLVAAAYPFDADIPNAVMAGREPIPGYPACKDDCLWCAVPAPADLVLPEVQDGCVTPEAAVPVAAASLGRTTLDAVAKSVLTHSISGRRWSKEAEFSPMVGAPEPGSEIADLRRERDEALAIVAACREAFDGGETSAEDLPAKIFAVGQQHAEMLARRAAGRELAARLQDELDQIRAAANRVVYATADDSAFDLVSKLVEKHGNLLAERNDLVAKIGAIQNALHAQHALHAQQKSLNETADSLLAKNEVLAKRLVEAIEASQVEHARNEDLVLDHDNAVTVARGALNALDALRASMAQIVGVK